MEEDAKKKLSDIDKLRKILDNPEDKSLKNTFIKNKNLESIQRRLTGSQPPEQPITSLPTPISSKSSNLEPRVTIHEPKTPEKPKETLLTDQKEEPKKEESNIEEPSTPLEPEQLFENPDGTPIRFDTDYFGNHRGVEVLPGPFASSIDEIKL